MPPFTLTPLLAADTVRLWTLDQLCFPPGIAYSEAEIRACLLQANRGFHAAIEVDGAPSTAPPAAFILSLLHRRRGHVITLDVALGYRRQGMGLALMQAAEERFQALGAVGMRLETAVDNDPARRFYARLGYREVRPLPNYYGRGLDGLLLLKDGFRAPAASISPACHN